MPDRSQSLSVRRDQAFQSGHSKECQRDLLKAAARNDVDVDCPFEELPKADQDWVLNGEGGDPEEAWQNGQWYGGEGIFRLARVEDLQDAYPGAAQPLSQLPAVPKMQGARLQPEALNFRIEPVHKTLPEVAATPFRDLQAEIASVRLPPADPTRFCCKTRFSPGWAI